MQCIFCKSTTTRAVNTRVIKENKIIKRRRECLKCHQRFTTHELALNEKVRKNYD